jgi:hypothetical protein
MRSWTIACYIFALNASFAILNSIQPFGPIEVLAGIDAIPLDLSDQTTVAGLDVSDMIGALNIVITLLVGPLTVLPLILAGLGITGTVAIVVVALGWIAYGLALVQLVTGRMLGTAR